MKYLKNFKKIIRIALSNNWLKVDPFANIKFHLEEVDMDFLTEEELNTFMNKYKDHPVCQKKGTVLPVLSNQKMNAYLREIADVCGIEKKLSTHIRAK